MIRENVPLLHLNQPFDLFFHSSLCLEPGKLSSCSSRWIIFGSMSTITESIPGSPIKSLSPSDL